MQKSFFLFLSVFFLPISLFSQMKVDSVRFSLSFQDSTLFRPDTTIVSNTSGAVTAFSNFKNQDESEQQSVNYKLDTVSGIMDFFQYRFNETFSPNRTETDNTSIWMYADTVPTVHVGGQYIMRFALADSRFRF